MIEKVDVSILITTKNENTETLASLKTKAENTEISLSISCVSKES